MEPNSVLYEDVFKCITRLEDRLIYVQISSNLLTSPSGKRKAPVLTIIQPTSALDNRRIRKKMTPAGRIICATSLAMSCSRERWGSEWVLGSFGAALLINQAPAMVTMMVTTDNEMMKPTVALPIIVVFGQHVPPQIPRLGTSFSAEFTRVRSL